MKKIISLIVLGCLLAFGALLFIKKENRVSTEIAKETKVTVTNKVVTDYSSFAVYVDSAEQVKRELEYTNRLILRSNMYKEQANEELKAEKESLLQEVRYLRNENKNLRDSLHAYQRVRYQSN